MADISPKPLIGVPVNLSIEEPRFFPRHTAGDKYVRVIAEQCGGVPVLIPALGSALDFPTILSCLDGLLLTGGRANVEPHHYGGPPFPDDEYIDPHRDATVLPLIRACVDHGIPVFGICRGIQEMNVALGGTLHYRVHLLPGKMDHRMRRDTEDIEERFALRHPIRLAKGGYLRSLVDEDEVMVNTLHGQAVDGPAPGLVVEARAMDDIIEAVRLPDAKRFTVGVQWHAEWRAAEHPLSRALFEAFGEDARAHAVQRGHRVA